MLQPAAASAAAFFFCRKIDVYRAESCPPLWGGCPRRGRERCNKIFRIASVVGKFVLPTRLFRHALRHATFPRGEGLTDRQTEICTVIFGTYLSICLWTFGPFCKIIDGDSAAVPFICQIQFVYCFRRNSHERINRSDLWRLQCCCKPD